MHVRTVHLHRAGREVKLARDLDARVPERGQPQNFNLTGRERVFGQRSMQGVQAHSDPWADEHLAPCRSPNGCRQHAVDHLLGDEPDSACGEGTLGEAGSSSIVMTTVCVFGRFLLQPADRHDARSARHVEIEHEHMRLVAQHMPLHSRDVIRFGDHIQALLAIEKTIATNGASARGPRPTQSGSEHPPAPDAPRPDSAPALDVRP